MIRFIISNLENVFYIVLSHNRRKKLTAEIGNIVKNLEYIKDILSDILRLIET
jgi:hypothetical protein